MRTKIAKWGNSYAVRLPRQLIEELQLHGELHVERRGEGIMLKKPSKEARLQELLKSMQAQSELEWGDARGKEVW